MQTNVSGLLVEAGTLLLVGMSVVFVFLTLLIGAINLIAMICSKFPEDDTQKPYARVGASRDNNKNQNQISPATVAAISAAVHQYRKSH